MAELVDNVALAFKMCNQQRERIAELEHQLAEEKEDFDVLDDQYHRRQLEGRLGEKYEAPVSEDYHFEDGAIMDALVGTTYLKGEVERFLRHATTGTKWSLYRAVAKLIAARAGKEQYNG